MKPERTIFMERDLTENELIAAFMGDHEDVLNNPKWRRGDELVYLKYHKSWDWIMPVVEKIESMGYKSALFCHSSNDHSFHIKDGSHSMFGDSFENTKIKAVYKAVSSFLKYYNQNRKQ